MPRKKTKNGPLTFDITPDELEIFLEGVNDCLDTMETGILHLEQKHDKETLNAVFRSAHTLKAVVGTVGHHQMADLTHTVETLFDEMREGRLSPTQTIIDQLLIVVDTLKSLRDEIVTGDPSGIDVAAIIDQLRALQTEAQAPVVTHNVTAAPHQLTPEQFAQVEASLEAGQTVLEIEVKASPASTAPAARLYQVAIALMDEGEILVQEPALDAIEEGDEQVWLVLLTSSSVPELEVLLAEIDELAGFTVSPYEMIKSRGSELQEASGGQHSEHMLDKTVRISIERLDSLMNLVGELVTNRTRFLQIEDMLRAQYGKDGTVGALSELVPHFSHVVDQLQEEVMRARMLPIASLFNKFPRLVRDTARAGGKQVDLVIEGEATELDRAVIELISDPLIHLLRNAIDHGIEPPEAREAAGKPVAGTVRVTAASVEGQIVVMVSDDGRGLDPERIRRAARQHKLLSPEEIAQLTEEEVIDLIFLPNLSTAAEVTEMSGRGVGLDVVRTNIERLSGSVVVSGEPGQGTTFRLTLPLTLALVQTMLVSVHQTLYAVPVTSINGAMYVAEAGVNTVRGKPVMDWQGSTLPLIDLREIFAHPRLGNGPSNGVKPSIVLVSWGKHRVGLIADRIIGQQEIVVKSLSPFIGPTPGLSGATILGDGRIALIVDVSGLVNTALRAQREAAK